MNEEIKAGDAVTLQHEGLEATFRCPWEQRGEIGFALLWSEYPWPKEVARPSSGLPVVTATTTTPGGEGWALIKATYGPPPLTSPS